jgi:hypothetical protein
MSRGHIIETLQKGAILVNLDANFGQFHSIRG